MTEFPTLCVLHYDHPDDTGNQRTASTGLRLQGPRRPRPRSCTHPRPRREEGFQSPSGCGGLHLLAKGVYAGGDGEVKIPYRYSSSKSSCSHTSNDYCLFQPNDAYSSLTTPELHVYDHTHDHTRQHHNHHHRSLSEPPPHPTKRAHTAPTSAFSLPVLRQGGAGETSLTVNAELLQDPRWNEYLSAWVSGNKASSHAFVNFVGAMSLKDRGRYHYSPKFEELPALPCLRFFEHMSRVQAPKMLFKEKKKKNLKKPEFWTWKGRTPPKFPKPKPIRKRVCSSQVCSSQVCSSQACSSPLLVQVSPPSSAQCLTVDVPSGSHESDRESPMSTPMLTPTSDLCSRSTPASSMREPSPDSSTLEEALPEIEEYSEPSDYGSVRSVPQKLHKLENPPSSPSTVDWDQHSYLQGFGDDIDNDDYDQDHHDHHKAKKDGTDNSGNCANQNGDSTKQKHATAGPLATSKVDQSSYMYNDHIVALEPLVFDAYSPLDNSSDTMESITVPGCKQSVVEPYPLEGPLQPDVADINRAKVHRSSILTRPKLPSPPKLKEPTPSPAPSSPKEHTPSPRTPTPSLRTPTPSLRTPTPPPPKVPTPHPPEVPTPPPIAKPQKKPTKPKRPLKKEKTKFIKRAEISTIKEAGPAPTCTPESIIAQAQTPTDLENVQTPTTQSISPVVTEESLFSVVSSPDESKESEPEHTDESATTSPEPDDAKFASPEELSATSAFSSTAATPTTASSMPTPAPPPLPSSPAERDMSLAQELERQRLAEERHRKAVLMYDKLRERQPLPIGMMEEDADSLMEYGWLAHFCILKPEKLKMYRMAFDTVDENHRGWLSCFDTLIALKGITGTQNLTNKEEEYICRILEIAGYNILGGADFRIFSIMAALSQKLSSVDIWVRNLIQKFDLQMLDWKIYRARELFEWCIDSATNSLSISHLLVELQAGGVSDEHLDEVRTEFGVDGALDLIDFLTYLPLFIMTHKSVVSNPLSDVRDK